MSLSYDPRNTSESPLQVKVRADATRFQFDEYVRGLVWAVVMVRLLAPRSRWPIIQSPGDGLAATHSRIAG